MKKTIIFIIVILCIPTLSFARSPFMPDDAQAKNLDGLPDDPERLRQIIQIMQQQTRQPSQQDRSKGRLIGIINGQEIFEHDLRNPNPLPKSQQTNKPEHNQPKPSQIPVNNEKKLNNIENEHAKEQNNEKDTHDKSYANSIKPAYSGDKNIDDMNLKKEINYFEKEKNSKSTSIASAVFRNDCDKRLWKNNELHEKPIHITSRIPDSISIYNFKFTDYNCLNGLIYDVGNGWMCGNCFDITSIKKDFPHFTSDVAYGHSGIGVR